MSRDGHDDRDWDMSPWMRAYYGYGASFLTDQTFQRVAQYQRNIANLTRQGSVEPRLWIGALQSFWSGLASDFGDYLRSYGGREGGADPVEVATEGPLIISLPIRIPEGAQTAVQSIDLPQNLFAQSVTKAKLVTRGLFIGNRCLLRPGYHILLEPKEITGQDRGFKLLFQNLPDELTAGMTLLGTIVAERACRKPDQDSYGDAAYAVLPQLLVAILQMKVI